MRSDNLFREDLLRENLLHPSHVVVADGDLHAQRGANQVANGAQLVTVKVDGHQK